VAYPRIIGANGPKMLALAGEVTDGAMPALQPPEFTAQARRALGPDKLLVVFMHANVGQGDAPVIAATVREHLAAGADHVMAGAPIGTDFAAGVDRQEQLAPALAELP
jgi:alkanesulfonate monooxygenase SsuD/methylene tetrahydromethanopterin reductase-like flavin-dependent oxidoreductase (luciferase family)